MKLNDLLVFANAIFTSKYNPDLITDLFMWSLPAEPVLLRQTVEKSSKKSLVSRYRFFAKHLVVLKKITTVSSIQKDIQERLGNWG